MGKKRKPRCTKSSASSFRPHLCELSLGVVSFAKGVLGATCNPSRRWLRLNNAAQSNKVMTTVTRKLDMENLCIGEFGRYHRHAKFRDGDRTMSVTVLWYFQQRQMHHSQRQPPAIVQSLGLIYIQKPPRIMLI